MSKRWNYQTVELKPRFRGTLCPETVQNELTKQGLQGWELVNIIHPATNHPALLVFKKEN